MKISLYKTIIAFKDKITIFGKCNVFLKKNDKSAIRVLNSISF